MGVSTGMDSARDYFPGVGSVSLTSLTGDLSVGIYQWALSVARVPLRGLGWGFSTESPLPRFRSAAVAPGTPMPSDRHGPPPPSPYLITPSSSGAATGRGEATHHPALLPGTAPQHYSSTGAQASNTAGVAGAWGTAASSSLTTEPTMTFDDGLPPFWSDTRQLNEARRLLLSATELVWPPPSHNGHSGGGTGGSDRNFRTFLCGHAAGRAVTNGIEFHLKLLSAQGGGSAVRHEPVAFVELLSVAGKQASDAWKQLQGLGSGGGGGGIIQGQSQRAPGGPELLARCDGSAERAMEEAVWEWQQEQQASQGGAAPLLRLVEATVEGGRGGGSNGASSVELLVQLDVAGLLDLAASIQLAEELAMDLLM